MFEINKPVKEAPLLGAVIGGLVGGGGTLAGIMSVGGMVGAGLGMVAGNMLGDAMGPKMPDMSIAQNTPTDVPSTPPAAVAPAVPGTAVETPGFTGGEGSPQTTDDVSTGELNRKRRGRVSTILTNREATVGEEEVERLGG
jgi:hypothetical protein